MLFVLAGVRTCIGHQLCKGDGRKRREGEAHGSGQLQALWPGGTRGAAHDCTDFVELIHLRTLERHALLAGLTIPQHAVVVSSPCRALMQAASQDLALCMTQTQCICKMTGYHFNGIKQHHAHGCEHLAPNRAFAPGIVLTLHEQADSVKLGALTSEAPGNSGRSE